MTISLNSIASRELIGLTGPTGPGGNDSLVITNVQPTDSSYVINGQIALLPAGGYAKITGAGFAAGCEVYVGNTKLTTVTRVDSTTLHVVIPAATAGNYHLYVTNTDGSTAIRANGIIYSDAPSWVTSATLTDQVVDVAVSIQLSATGAVSYALATGSSLPSGLTLSASGLISGTVTGLSSSTVYNFSIDAIDAENQTTTRAFSLTIAIVYELYAWGGQESLDGAILGINASGSRSSPVQIGSTAEWKVAGAGIGIKSNNSLWTWGPNSNGELGNGTQLVNLEAGPFNSSPVQVGSLTTWSKVYAGNQRKFAINTSNKLFAWGNNSNGALGDGTAISRSSPVQIGSSDWSAIYPASSNTGYHNFGIRTDGTLWAWGNNVYGMLGQNDTAVRSSPVQIGSSTWLSAAGTDISGAGVRSDGTLWTWGQSGGAGLLGRGNASEITSSPVQVGSDTNWSKVYAGFYCLLAIKTDGTLWSWGLNGVGALGLGDTASRSVPTQVGSGTNWSSISAFGIQFNSATSVIGLKTDGTLWSWGDNSSGQLGHGDAVSRSVPTQIGSSTLWSSLGSSTSLMAAFALRRSA